MKAQEEVVVRKEVGERVEKVRDTVRETKVDIDRAAAGDKPQERDTGPLGPLPKALEICAGEGADPPSPQSTRFSLLLNLSETVRVDPRFIPLCAELSAHGLRS